jgi:hypothetical protein
VPASAVSKDILSLLKDLKKVKRVPSQHSQMGDDDLQISCPFHKGFCEGEFFFKDNREADCFGRLDEGIHAWVIQDLVVG